MKPSSVELKAFFFCFVLILCQLLSAVGADGGTEHVANGQDVEQEEPSLSEIAKEAVSLIKNYRKTSWDNVKTLLHKVQLRISPPNLDFRGSGDKTKAAEDMKGAAEKSFEKSKSTVKNTAKSAAEAVHKTAEKMAESVSNEEKETKSEL